MSVRPDCRHYLLRTTAAGEALQRCRLAVNEESPFACPEGCLFHEGRPLLGAGWAQAPSSPMSNTSTNLPEPSPRKRGKGKRRR
jgi:hypothetical protein